MSLLLAIDPGVTCPGAALFDIDTKELVGARFFVGGGFKNDLARIVNLSFQVAKWAPMDVTHAVFEWPQIYGGRRSGGRKDPNDMLPLAAFNGAMAVTLWGHTDISAPYTVFTPHKWKGSKEKNPTARMVLSRLTYLEHEKIDDINAFEKALAASGNKECEHPTMNAVDAVGIGLHHLGRLERKRVITR